MSTKRYQKNAEAGQLPLLTPKSEWVCPTELPDWRGRPIIAADIETKDDGLAQNRGAGWVYGAGYIAGLSIASEAGAMYLPVRHPDGDCLDEDAVRRWYIDHVRAGVRFVFHRAVYDLGWLRAAWEAPFPEKLEDTIVADFMREENEFEYNLDAVCARLGIPGKDMTLLRVATQCYGGDVKNPAKTLWKLPARFAAPYAMQDAAATLAAHDLLQKHLQSEGTVDAYRLEIDLIPLIVEMRERGIRVDVPYFESLSVALRKKRDAALAELSKRLSIGRSVDIRDVRQNSFLVRCFDAEKIPYPRTPPTKGRPEGQPSFEADWMKKRDHWLPRLVVAINKYDGAAGKFVDNYILGFAHRGRIHAEIHQTKTEDGGTKTTRLAYSDPPLQQSPSRDEELGPAFRKGFLPEKDEVWAAPDVNQQEYRLIVHGASVCRVAGAEKPVEIYQRDPHTDFHNVVVQLTGLVRRDAKDANFAKAYRAGVPKFALMIDKSVDEAREIYEQYDREMPFVSRFAEFMDSRAQARGYLILLDGARAHFNRWETRWLDRDKWQKGFEEEKKMNPCSRAEAEERTKDSSHPWYQTRLRRADTYKAANKWVQGGAARQTKLAMRACYQEGIVPLLQMHDELDLSVGEERTALRVQELMRDAVKLVVPTVIDLEYGKTWGDAKVVKDKDGKVIYDASWSAALASMKG